MPLPDLDGLLEEEDVGQMHLTLCGELHIPEGGSPLITLGVCSLALRGIIQSLITALCPDHYFPFLTYNQGGGGARQEGR